MSLAKKRDSNQTGAEAVDEVEPASKRTRFDNQNCDNQEDEDQ